MQQISIEGVLDKRPLRGQGDALGVVQEIRIWPYEQMVYTQPSIYHRKWHTHCYRTLTYKRIT